MVLLVDARSRYAHAAELEEMYKVRKRVFVDALKWDLRIENGVLEKDEFDFEGARYLIVLEEGTGRHLGSVRLLPTTGPTLTSKLFSHLCRGGAPGAEDVWEITRLCTTPGLARAEAMRVRHKITCALVEWALVRGITRYVCVLNVSWLPTLLAPGWSCDPLGEPCLHDGELIGAFAVNISPATLMLLREKWGGRFPVLEIPEISRVAA